MPATLWHKLPLDVVDQTVLQTIALLVNAEAVSTLDSMPHAPDDIAVAVYCDDAQQSAAMVCCSRSLAATFSSAMLEMDRDALTDGDMIDVVGEISNVIAGGLRGLMANPGAMSTPFAVTSEEVALLDPASERCYCSGGEIFSLFRF